MNMWLNGRKFLLTSEDTWVEETVNLDLTSDEPEIKSIIQVITTHRSDSLVTCLVQRTSKW